MSANQSVFTRHILPVILAAVALLAVAATGVENAAVFYHSDSISATNPSQTVSTTRMRTSDCTGWLFRNRGAGTVYINLNVADGYNGDASATDKNMYVLPAGEVLELQDALIKRFAVYAAAPSEVYWFCGCK